jgi:hypothetical protein
VTVAGVPLPEEAAALCELPELRHLVLHDPDPLADLARLRPLADRLDILELHGVDEPNVRSAEKAVGDDLAAKLRTHRHQLSRSRTGAS